MELLREIENRVRDYWKEIDLKRVVLEENEKREEIFWLLDGPPYPNDVPHVGHSRNIVTKDFFLKYAFLHGYRILFRPGFDTHGLPIEVKVEKLLGLSSKKDIEEKVGVKEFIKKCREFAMGNAEKWLEYYEKIGHWYSFCDSPYLTMSKEYIETAWYLFKKIWENGLVYRDERPVWWCPRCETALAGYEVVDEYADLEDPSIYVLFPVEGEENTYLLVWTTTPWTLNANVAIAAHPEETYVKVELSDGRKIILAEKRLHLLEEWEIGYRVLEKFPGKKLEGLKYKGVIDNEIQRELDKHPKAHRVIMSIPIFKGYVPAKVMAKKKVEEEEAVYEHLVNVEEGTGLVHIAPGHGKEDFIIGQHYGLPAYSPVAEDGTITIGPFKGLKAREANDKIIEYLRERGLLLRAEKIVHRYPLCWRCKTPLIVIMHRDFFISIQKIKEKMLDAVKKIKFMPEFARSRMISWINGEEDWDVSRLRYWGIPIPVWVCENCGNVVVIGSAKELAERAGLDKEPEDLHRDVVDDITFKCDKCGGTMRRVRDIFDVWFDSGSATFASLHWPFENKELFEKAWRVDFICEGQDQIRGWFDRLLEVSIAAVGDYPYDSVLMFGWVVDAKGQKMSKRLGNVIFALESWEKLGADISRTYILWKAAPWDTIAYDMEEARKEIGRAFNIIMNVTKYILERGKMVGTEIKELKVEDVWLISKFNSLVKELEEYVDRGRLDLYVRKLLDFGVNTVSRDYIKYVRERVQVEGESTPIGVLLEVWKKFLVMLAPVAPFLAEYLYQQLKELDSSVKKTIFLESFPRPEEEKIKKDVEYLFDVLGKIIDAAARVRSDAGIKLRYPLKEAILSTEFKQLCDPETLRELVRRTANIVEVYFADEKEVPEHYVCEEITGKEGKVVGKVWFFKEFDREMAFISEFCRFVQEARKRRGLKIAEVVEVAVDGDKEALELIKRNIDFVEKRTNCKFVFRENAGEERKILDYTVRFEILS